MSDNILNNFGILVCQLWCHDTEVHECPVSQIRVNTITDISNQALSLVKVYSTIDMSDRADESVWASMRHDHFAWFTIDYVRVQLK